MKVQMFLHLGNKSIFWQFGVVFFLCRVLFSFLFSPFYISNNISFFIYFSNWREAEYFSKLIAFLIFDANNNFVLCK